MVCPQSDTPSDIGIPTTPIAPKKSKRLSEMNEVDRKLQEFYNSKEWRKKREKIIQRAKGLCEVCWRLGRIRNGKEVHHIIKIRTDWSKRLDDNNLIYVCSSCHHKIEEECFSLDDLIKFIEEEKKRLKKKD